MPLQQEVEHVHRGGGWHGVSSAWAWRLRHVKCVRLESCRTCAVEQLTKAAGKEGQVVAECAKDVASETAQAIDEEKTVGSVMAWHICDAKWCARMVKSALGTGLLGTLISQLALRTGVSFIFALWYGCAKALSPSTDRLRGCKHALGCLRTRNTGAEEERGGFRTTHG